MRLLAALWLLGTGVAWAAAVAAVCEPPPGALELALEGVATLYFQALEPTEAGGLELSGGVCVLGETGWSLAGEALSVAGLGEALSLRAEQVTLALGETSLVAAGLTYAGDALSLTQLSFTVGEVTGEAEAGRVVPTSGAATLERVRVWGRGFRIAGTTAALSGDALILTDAEITTCLCEGPPLYVIRAPSARYDLARQELRVERGELLIGALAIPLDALGLDASTLEELDFPLAIEYVPDSAAGVGTGLGVRLRNLPVGEGFRLELGLLGLDVEYPLRAVLVARYEDEHRAFAVGSTGEGPLAEVRVREPLGQGFSARFETVGRHYPSSDYLHQGLFALDAQARRSLLRGDELSLSQSAFAAVSSQYLPRGPVVGPRLGLVSDLAYRAPPQPWGQLAVTLRLEATHYPAQAVSQYGVRFRPSWSARVGGLALSAGYDGLWTNAASPFGRTLDRLEPRNVLSLSGRYGGTVLPGVRAAAGVALSYDFLTDAPNGYLWERVGTLRADAEATWQEGGLTVRPHALLELAPLLNPGLQGRALLETGVEVGADRWQVGFLTRFDLESETPFDKLEASVTFPITLGRVDLQPFLALDVLPLLAAGLAPRVSGHGLEVTYRSCCGTVQVGYRQQENRFTTSFALRLGEW